MGKSRMAEKGAPWNGAAEQHYSVLEFSRNILFRVSEYALIRNGYLPSACCNHLAFSCHPKLQ